MNKPSSTRSVTDSAGRLHLAGWLTHRSSVEAHTKFLTAQGEVTPSTAGSGPRGLALNASSSAGLYFGALVVVSPSGSQVVWRAAVTSTGTVVAASLPSLPRWADEARSLVSWQHGTTLYRAALT